MPVGSHDANDAASQSRRTSNVVWETRSKTDSLQDLPASEALNEFKMDQSPSVAHKDRLNYQSQRPGTPAAGQKSVNRTFALDASLVLVGIRGCGKRSLGFIAATALGRRFITEDRFFQNATGLSRQEYLRQHGKQKFHREESIVSIKMLEENKSDCVIECGLASLTSSVQEHLRKYARTNPVIYLIRDMTRIATLLNLEDNPLRLLANADPTHRHCSNFEYFNLEENATASLEEAMLTDRGSPTYSFKLKDSREDFSNFVRFITRGYSHPGDESAFSLSQTPLEQLEFTHCLQIQLSPLLNQRFKLSELEARGDLAEIKIDRWYRGLAKEVSEIVSQIRRIAPTPIMIGTDIENVELTPESNLAILEHALRLGVEFISVDLRLTDQLINAVVGSKGFTRVIGSFFENSVRTSWADQIWTERYERAQRLGCDMVRFTNLTDSREEDDRLTMFRLKAKDSGRFQIPLIAFNTGPLGRTSQIFNKIFTSVTHPTLLDAENSEKRQYSAQLSSHQVFAALFRSFVFDPLEFSVIGAKVSNSLSPYLHNAAYEYLGLEHVYKTQEITSFADFEAIGCRPDFGGASIAQPWKVQLLEHLASLSNHAKSIGAVNTVLPLRGKVDGNIPALSTQAGQRNRMGPVVAWFGDNTDWIGIKVCMTRNLSPRNVVQPKTSTALVIGAGGMARAAIYAVLKLGCRNIFIFNRTLAHAEAVARHFNSKATDNGFPLDGNGEIVRVLKSREEAWPSGYKMPTMIISCVTQETIYGREPANFTMPLQWLGSESGGVVMELSYASKNTPLMQQIRQVRKETKVPWVTVDGFETLPEQAIAQFELMTGRKAPRKCFREALVKAAAEREAQVS